MRVRKSSRFGRNTLEIRIWLMRNGMTMKSVADGMGSCFSIVSETVNGRRNSRRVLRYLLGLGCPKDILSVPDDMRGAV